MTTRSLFPSLLLCAALLLPLPRAHASASAQENKYSWLKIGAGVVITGAAAYGLYCLSQRKKSSHGASALLMEEHRLTLNDGGALQVETRTNQVPLSRPSAPLPRRNSKSSLRASSAAATPLSVPASVAPKQPGPSSSATPSSIKHAAAVPVPTPAPQKNTAVAHSSPPPLVSPAAPSNMHTAPAAFATNSSSSSSSKKQEQRDSSMVPYAAGSSALASSSGSSSTALTVPTSQSTQLQRYTPPQATTDIEKAVERGDYANANWHDYNEDSPADHDGNKAAHRAAVRGDGHLIRVLTGQVRTVATPFVPNQLTNLHAQNKQGKTSLHLIVESGCLDAFEAYRGYGRDQSLINSGDNAGHTALHTAMEHGHAHFITPLIQARADINASAKNGQTPAGLALEKYEPHVLNALQPHASTINKSKLMHHAATFQKFFEAYQEKTPSSTQLALMPPYAASGAPQDIPAEDVSAQKALAFTFDQSYDPGLLPGTGTLYGAVQDNRRETVIEEIEKAAHLHAQDKNGNTVGHVASAKGARSNLDLLTFRSTADDAQGLVMRVKGGWQTANPRRKKVIKPTDLTTRNFHGETALHYGVQSGSAETVSACLQDLYLDYDNQRTPETDKRGKDGINAKTAGRNLSPAHIAVFYERAHLLPLLASEGADLNAQTHTGLSVFGLAYLQCIKNQTPTGPVFVALQRLSKHHPCDRDKFLHNKTVFAMTQKHGFPAFNFAQPVEVLKLTDASTSSAASAAPDQLRLEHRSEEHKKDGGPIVEEVGDDE